MMNSLTVINLKPQSNARPSSGEVFVLKTCQRTIILGLDQMPFYHLENQNDVRDMYNGDQAYIFLLETICGLKSEVLAEYEVVAQFKDAYNAYNQLPLKNNQILNVLEKLFQDSKKIRTEHLTEIGQLSYAGITRKLIYTKSHNSDVLILGSGNLAVDLIKLLKKKHRVFLSARNSEKACQLALEHSLELVPWLDRELYKRFDSIVNTIGTGNILLEHSFFEEWMPWGSSKLFVDLGSPSAIQTPLSFDDGVLRLEDIFHQSTKMNIEKMEKIKRAKESIVRLCENRRQTFTIQPAMGSWEELQLA